MNALHASALPAGRRLHVLEVVGNAIIGGMERFVERLVEHLPAEQFKLTVLCPFEGLFTERLRGFGAEVLICPMPDDPPWSAVHMVSALVESSGVDLLHAHLPNAHLLAGLAGRLTGTPVLATIHGRQLGMQDLEVHRLLGSHLSMVCQQSYFHALGIGVDRQSLSCEPNGVDTRQFQPGARPAEGLRQRFGIPAEAPLVGFVGRLSPEKGPEVFVRSVLLMHERLRAAHFVIVGDGPMRISVRDFIKRYKLQGFTHMAGNTDDMPQVFRELDLVVSSSHSEAMPLALMEAMSSGVPVVATRVGGVPDMVEHGRCGWLVAPRDFEDIAGRVVQTFSTPGLREQMGAHARATMVERMDLRQSLGRVAALMQSLVAPAAELPRIGPLVNRRPRKAQPSLRQPRPGAAA